MPNVFRPNTGRNTAPEPGPGHGPHDGMFAGKSAGLRHRENITSVSKALNVHKTMIVDTKYLSLDLHY